jgi:hypothetical protein
VVELKTLKIGTIINIGVMTSPLLRAVAIFVPIRLLPIAWQVLVSITRPIHAMIVTMSIMNRMIAPLPVKSYSILRLVVR